MNRNQSVYRLAVAALLVAVGIIIPTFMPFPLKFPIPPMSFTLASHVAIFLAMFISPFTAVAVALGTTVGFVFSGLPPEVWMRALSHVVWALVGAWWLQKRPKTPFKAGSSAVFCLSIGVLHAALELTVVLTLYFGGFAGLAQKWSSVGFATILLLVGLGTVVHSVVDYILSLVIWRPLTKVAAIREIATSY